MAFLPLRQMCAEIIVCANALNPRGRNSKLKPAESPGAILRGISSCRHTTPLPFCQEPYEFIGQIGCGEGGNLPHVVGGEHFN